MKKLMTMIAAVATAFGLYAADSGTSFEGSAGGKLSQVYGGLTELDTAVQDKTGYWAFDKDDTAEVVPFGGTEARPEYRPGQYEDEGNYYLKLSSGTNLLKRNYSTSGSFNAVSKSLYFDSVVKMTAFDADPEITDAKLAVWLRDTSDDENVVDPATNLMVTVAGVDYNCGNRPALLETWARVTIKALPIGGEKIGLAVWINETPVTCDALSYAGVTLGNDYAKQLAAEKALFVPAGDDTTITYAGFAGMGSIDDLVFTETAPSFAADYTFKKVAWDDGVTGFTCGLFSTNGLTAAGNVTFQYEDELPTVSDVTYATGKMAKEIKDVEGVETIYSQDAGAVLTINGVDTPYATAAAAIEYLNGDEITTPTEAALKLNTSGAGFELDNENVTLVLDLAGKTITAAAESDAITVTAGTLSITNTTDDIGSVVAATGKCAVNEVSGTAYCYAGIYEGIMGVLNGETWGTKFSKEGNTDPDGEICLLAVPTEVTDTLEFVEDGTYWKLAPIQAKKGTVIFICGKTGLNTDPAEVEPGVVTSPAIDATGIYTAEGWYSDQGLTTPAELTIAAGETKTFYAKAQIEFNEDSDGNKLINELTDLKKLQAAVADGETFTGVTFKQTAAEIDMTGIDWAGIGTYDTDTLFNGTYDGDNKAIVGVTYTKKTYSAFFNAVGANAVIKNLSITVAGWAEGEATEYGCAAFIGASLKNGLVLQNLKSYGTIRGNHTCGGIAVKINGSTTDGAVRIENCVNYASVTSDRATGSKCAGLVGFTQGNSTSHKLAFNCCSNLGPVEVTGHISNAGCGGLVGWSYDNLIFTDCYSDATKITILEGDEEYCGSFCGMMNVTTITESGSGNVQKGLMAPIGKNVNAPDFTFATVENDVATFQPTLAKDTAYTQMVPITSDAAIFTLEAAGDTFILNTNGLAFAGTVVAKDDTLVVTPAVSGSTITWTAAAKPSDPWPQPTDDTEVAQALADAGFSATAQAAITTKVDYDKFVAYCKETLELTDPAILGSNIKANALISYALDCGKLSEEITSDDVTITAYDAATGDIVVKIEGVTPGENVKSDVLAKVLTAKGGIVVTALDPANVTVAGQCVEEGVIKVKVTPKATGNTAFFTQILLNK